MHEHKLSHLMMCDPRIKLCEHGKILSSFFKKTNFILDITFNSAEIYKNIHLCIYTGVLNPAKNGKSCSRSLNS